jgi:hypothetical protein
MRRAARFAQATHSVVFAFVLLALAVGRLLALLLLSILMPLPLLLPLLLLLLLLPLLLLLLLVLMLVVVLLVMPRLLGVDSSPSGVLLWHVRQMGVALFCPSAYIITADLATCRLKRELNVR